MKNNNNSKISTLFDRFAGKAARITGSSTAFIIAFALIVGWAVSGPFFHFSNAWQLAINTGTTITTFLMVFIIQEAQNKDTLAVQLKLDELIAATKGASNRVLNIEDMTEEELKVMKKFYERINQAIESEESGAAHSIDEHLKDSINEELNK